MYVGHVGIALGARAIRRDVPLWLLILASQGCDWLDVLFGNLLRVADNSVWSHSLPSVAIGAVTVGALALLLTRSRPAAGICAAVYVSHILVDYLTGYKPLFFKGPVVGLGLYGKPVIDFALEAAFIVAGWSLYRRSLPAGRREEPALGALLAALLAFQLIADTAFAVRGVLKRRDMLPEHIARIETPPPASRA